MKQHLLLAGFLQQNEGVSWGYGPGVCSVGCPRGGAGRDGGALSDNIKHGRADLRKRLIIRKAQYAAWGKASLGKRQF